MLATMCTPSPGPKAPGLKKVLRSARRHFVEDKRSILLKLQTRVNGDLDKVTELLDKEEERLPKVDDATEVNEPEVIVKDFEEYDL